jgi:long-chain acyl-CoA synthetase
VFDLAVQAAGMVHVPLPSFFSEAQIQHAVRSSSMLGMASCDPALAARMGFDGSAVRGIDSEKSELVCYRSAVRRRPDRFVAIPRTVSKMTFTSGTTATPKAVLLSHAHQLGTARSLADATSSLGIRRHLCLLPLPVLLENVAGAYTALLTGVECIVPSMSAAGMTGASHFDAQRCLETMVRERADSIIVLPQMLAALVDALDSGAAEVRPDALKLVAVGGAHTPETLIRRARTLGLPVYEGYGLSECASVTTLNLPGADRVGTVGRPLPGVAVRLDDESEIQVCGRGFEGYLGAPESKPEKWFATGDIGRVDADGYVSIIGRRKHVLVTSFGRNVSPEWPEGLLTTYPGILQAAVFGDARPFLCAVIVAASALDDAQIDAHIAAVNANLPDYARIRHWIRALEHFTPNNGLATANGRLRRAVIEARYADALTTAYERQSMPSASPPVRASIH